MAFCRALDKVALDKPDIVCLGEGITKVGNREIYITLAEPIPRADQREAWRKGSPA